MEGGEGLKVIQAIKQRMEGSAAFRKATGAGPRPNEVQERVINEELGYLSPQGMEMLMDALNGTKFARSERHISNEQTSALREKIKQVRAALFKHGKPPGSGNLGRFEAENGSYTLSAGVATAEEGDNKHLFYAGYEGVKEGGSLSKIFIVDFTEKFQISLEFRDIDKPKLDYIYSGQEFKEMTDEEYIIANGLIDECVDATKLPL